MKAPIFLFSLPRSGSTLLQRILMSHNEISSLAEPWLLLPFIYIRKPLGTLTEYSHNGAFQAINSFINNLPDKEKDYYYELNRFIFSLYEKLCFKNELYFLDKTPRYYLIIPEIARVFPDAKFIFLFRNPIRIMSSIIETWCSGTFKGIHNYHVDLKIGYQKLSEGYRLLKNNAYALQYEKLVLNPEKFINEICDYLDIHFFPEMLNDFSKQDTKGIMGDPTGIKHYNTISNETLNKWSKTFYTSYRIKQVKKIIKDIRYNDLKEQGYDADEIIQELNNAPVKNNIILKDYIHVIRWKLLIKYNLNIFAGSKTRKWTKEIFLS